MGQGGRQSEVVEGGATFIHYDVSGLNFTLVGLPYIRM